jgi:TRAP-type uncharacterized transport system fused permease subunit
MRSAAARPYARTIFALQAALTLVVVGYTLDLQRRWLGLALYTEQFLVAVLGLAIALAFLTVPAHPRWRARVPWWDALAAALGLGLCLHVAWDYPRLVNLLTARPLDGIVMSAALALSCSKALGAPPAWRWW